MGLGKLVKPAMGVAKKVGEYAINNPDKLVNVANGVGNIIKPAKKNSTITEQDFYEIQSALRTLQSENENLKKINSETQTEISDLNGIIVKLKKTLYICMGISIVSIIVSILAIMF